jgi:hypothetical protein
MSDPQYEFIHQDPSSAERNSIDFVHIGTTALGSLEIKKPNKATHMSEEAYLSAIEKSRTAILEMENNTEGLNLSRVSEFREQIGAPEKAIRYLNPDDYAKAIRLGTLNNDENSSDAHGRYLEHLDMIVVNRDLEFEELNGPEWTEAIAVHEIAHSSAEFHTVQVHSNTSGRIFKKTSAHMTRARSGFVVHDAHNPKTSVGQALEEAYADYERGQYVLSLGREGGFVTPDGTDFDHPGNLPLPGHYWWNIKEPDGAIIPAFPPVSSASATLELLIDRDPTILTALRESRHSADGYRDLRRKMDAVAPQVFEHLREVDYQQPDRYTEMMGIYADLYYKFSEPAA